MELVIMIIVLILSFGWYSFSYSQSYPPIVFIALPTIIIIIGIIIDLISHAKYSSSEKKSKEDSMKKELEINKLINQDFYVKKVYDSSECYDIYSKKDNTVYLSVWIDNRCIENIEYTEVVKVLNEKIKKHGKGKVLFTEMLHSLDLNDLLIIYTGEAYKSGCDVDEIKEKIRIFKDMYVKLKSISQDYDTKLICNANANRLFNNIEDFFNKDSVKDFYVKSKSEKYKEEYLDMCVLIISSIIDSNKIKKDNCK